MSEQLYDQYQDALKRARVAEKQLQEAREENIKQDETIEFLHIVIDDLKAKVAQAQALLEEIAGNFVPTQWNKSRLVYCDLCNEYGETPEQIEHRPNCFVAKARAFLGKEA